MFPTAVQSLTRSRVYAGQIVVTGPSMAVALTLLWRNFHLGVMVLFFLSLEVLCDSVLAGVLFIYSLG